MGTKPTLRGCDEEKLIDKKAGKPPGGANFDRHGFR